MIITYVLVGAVVGALLGWTVRNSMDSTRTRVLEELYSRKLRLAEQLRDESIKTLNANRVEMAGHGERFAALDLEIETQRESLGREQAARASAQDQLDDFKLQNSSLRETIAGHLERFALLDAEHEARRESLERERSARSAAQDELDGLKGEISGWREAAEQALRSSEAAERRAEEAELRSAGAANAMDQAYGEVMDLSNTLTRTEQLLGASSAQAAELEVQIVQRDLTLDDMRGSISRLNHDLDHTREELSRRDGEIARLEALAAELEPLRAALLERDQQLAQMTEHSARQAELIERWTPLAESFPGTESQRAALAERTRELGMQLELVVAQAAELPVLRRELELSQKRAGSLAERQRELEAHLERVEARAAELPALRKELEQVHGRANSTEKTLERERLRGEKLQANAQASDEELRAQKRELARLEKELSVAHASAESKQRDVERRDAKLANLEAALAERNNRIRTLTPVSRSPGARGTLRPQPAKRPSQTPVSDDLKRIAGIGPVLAKKLRRLGVATFDQLAELTRPDLDALAEKLGIASERIRREGWVSSARVEARARNGN